VPIEFLGKLPAAGNGSAPISKTPNAHNVVRHNGIKIQIHQMQMMGPLSLLAFYFACDFPMDETWGMGKNCLYLIGQICLVK
jgi:hypothetical protein